MTNGQFERIRDLRRQLHACPEISGREERTRALLEAFLRENTSLEICSCGGGFYAAHRESNPVKGGIALRADYDALALPDGGAGHLCGHDGHAAALCALALLLEGQTLGREVFLLFQPAEETGAGALPCTALLESESVSQIYGCHNLPGLPLGQIFTRPGTFACASRGLILHFRGSYAHAAYPELGRSPAKAVGRLLCALDTLAEPERFDHMTLCTVIGVQMGEKAFGAAAAQAEVWLTLRAEQDGDLLKLRTGVLDTARELGERHALDFAFEEQDVFPATENNPGCAARVLQLPGAAPLDKPMRWSEDFGHYLQKCPGAFFGIGAGESCPALHSADYEYPDTLLRPTAEAFLALLTD